MITSTVAGRRKVFSDWRTGRLLVKELKAVEDQGLARSLAWVVMPDHFHWLLELNSSSLDKLMQRVKSKSGIAVNRALGLTGKLWQDGYHDTAIRDEEDLPGIARYIAANPLRAGLVKQLGLYPLWDCIWLE